MVDGTNTFEAGTFNANCDQCGSQYKAYQLRLQWNGLRCCSGAGTNDCWEARNVQESVRGKAERQAPPWTRPGTDGPDVSVETGTPVRARDL